MRTIDLALERQQKLISCWIKRCDILSKDVTKKPPEIFFSICVMKTKQSMSKTLPPRTSVIQYDERNPECHGGLACVLKSREVRGHDTAFISSITKIEMGEILYFPLNFIYASKVL